MILACPRCGESFAQGRHNQRFCSASCQLAHNQALYRQRKRGGIAPSPGMPNAGLRGKGPKE